jgi:hypothetical protein
MRVLLSLALFSFFGTCAPKPLPSLGKVDPKQLCDDPARCEARGDAVHNALKNGPPPYLAAGAGPEQFLGRVAPARNPSSALKSCGGDVKPADWLSTAPAIREVLLDKEGKQRIYDAMKAQLVAAMGKAGLIERADADLKANVDAAVAAVDFAKVSLVEQTHWLSDAAFEKRVGQCGEDFYEQVIYSITVISMADLFQKDLEMKLGASLAAKLIKSAAAPSEAPATDPQGGLAAPEGEAVPAETAAAPEAPTTSPSSVPSSVPSITTQECQAVAHTAVNEVARSSRFVAAFGFDDR